MTKDKRVLKRYTRKNKSAVTRFSNGDLCFDGCVYLVGQIVRQAVADAANNYKANKGFKRDAMRFLFTPGELETFFAKYHLDGLANCAMIRTLAQDIISGRKELDDAIKFNTDQEIQEPTETEDA